MIWNPWQILQLAFNGQRREMQYGALRWTRAFRTDPELAQDLIRLGHVLEMEPVTLVQGVEQPTPIDPYRMAYEKGRRDLAIQILALGRISQTELNALMEDPHGTLPDY